MASHQNVVPVAGRNQTSSCQGNEPAEHAQHKPHVAGQADRCMAELYEGVHDELDLLGVGTRAGLGRAWQLFEGQRRLPEAGPGNEPAHVAIELRMVLITSRTARETRTIDSPSLG